MSTIKIPCKHPDHAMLYSDDYCCCKECEQGWDLVEYESSMGRSRRWVPNPLILKAVPAFKKYPKKPKTRALKNNFRK